MNKTVSLVQAAQPHQHSFTNTASVGADIFTLNANRKAIIHRIKRNCSDFKENLEPSMSKRRLVTIEK